MHRIAAPRTWLAAGLTLVCAVACSGPGATTFSEDKAGGHSWPMLGGTPQRNMANLVEKGLPDTWSLPKGKGKEGTNVKWSAALGSLAYGGPVVARGKVFVGTNNDHPRDPAVKGDRGVLMCFREADGKFLWQAVHEKLPNPDQNDWPKQGVASTPVIDEDRVYYVSNACELVCADVEGDPATGKAKILWKLDMVEKLHVYPCFLAMCSPLMIGDLVFAVTGNGVDPGTNPHTVPEPKAPSFVAVNKKTGELVWQDASPGNDIMEGQWSNPTAARVAGKDQVIFPGGDGWLYAFDPPTGKLLWKFNCNPRAAVYKAGGRGDRNYILATPVVCDNLLYVAVGQNPEDGPGVGHLWCIDVTKEPTNKDRDLSPVGDNFDPKAPANKGSALVWHYGGPVVPKPTDNSPEFVFGRTISTVAVHDGLVYAAELLGIVHCLDAKTGKKYWTHDMLNNTWASPMYADGKVYLGNDGGEVCVFSHGKELKEPGKINVDQAVKGPLVAANGVLFLNTGTTLYALMKK